MNDDANKSLIEQELSIIEKIELAGKFAAISLPLTYVSGYLISTSYLGTYGLRLNASELFRAKYIYVGFLYLMFLLLIIAIFSVFARILELRRMTKRDTGKTARMLFDAEKALSLEVLRVRNQSLSSQNRRKFQELRGDLVVGLIVLVFTVEIMFLNPVDLGGVLPFQSLYLLTVAIYQLTFYREVHEPFTWGLVNGRRYIEDIRWLLMNAQGFAAAGLFLHVLVNAIENAHGSGRLVFCLKLLGWLLISATIEIVVLAGLSIRANKERLIEIDKDDRFNPVIWEAGEDVGKEIKDSFKQLRALQGSWIGYFMPCSSRHPFWFRFLRLLWLVITFVATALSWRIHIFSHPTFWTSVCLVGAPLLLSLFVLANVGLLPLLFSRRSRRLGFSDNSPESGLPREEMGSREIQRKKWERYARRVVMGTVLYVTSVLSFSYVVYPHIPVQKAGGNYMTANKVDVVLAKETSTGECPGVFLPAPGKDEAYIVLEEDADWVYLANDHDPHPNGGPNCWRWAGMENLYCRPHVYAVSRACIAGIVDISHGN